MAWPFSATRIRELVTASKCLAAGQKAEFSSQGDGKELSILLDLIDGGSYHLRLIVTAGRADTRESYEAALLLNNRRVRDISYSKIERKSISRSATSRKAGTRTFSITRFPQPSRIATTHSPIPSHRPARFPPTSLPALEYSNRIRPRPMVNNPVTTLTLDPEQCRHALTAFWSEQLTIERERNGLVLALPLMLPDGVQIAVEIHPISERHALLTDAGDILRWLAGHGLNVKTDSNRQWLEQRLAAFELSRNGFEIFREISLPFKASTFIFLVKRSPPSPASLSGTKSNSRSSPLPMSKS